MSDETSEVDLQAILARLNANADDEPDDTEAGAGMSDILNEKRLEPENFGTESNINDRKKEREQEKEEELNVSISEELKEDVETDIHSNQNSQPSQPTDTNKIESAAPHSENVHLKEQTENHRQNETNKLETNPDSVLSSVQEIHDIDKDEEPARKSSLLLSSRKDSVNSTDNSDLLERIQKIKNQILTVREDAEDEGTQEMLTEQSKSIQMSNSILRSAGVRQTAIDDQQLQAIVDAVTSIYSNNFGKITNRQNELFEVIRKIRARSDFIATLFDQKQLFLAKMQSNLIEKNINEIRHLEDGVDKTKGALKLVVQRLEELETVLDFRLESKRLAAVGKLKPHGQDQAKPSEAGNETDNKTKAKVKIWND